MLLISIEQSTCFHFELCNLICVLDLNIQHILSTTLRYNVDNAF